MPVPRIVVVGSINSDVTVAVSRFPAVGETIQGDSVTFGPGGKGLNQAVAIALSGARCQMIAAVGGDQAGADILKFLKANGVITDYISTEPGELTGAAYITLAAGENHIVTLPGANARVTAHRLTAAAPAFEGAAAVVVQGELPLATTEAAIAIAARLGVRPIVNMAPVQSLSAAGISVADPLVLNEIEAAELLDEPPVTSVAQAGRLATSLLDKTRSAVITLGDQGAVIAEQDTGPIHIPARQVANVVDTVGAGDAFVGVLAAGLAQGLPLAQAAQAGNAAAADAITRRGAAPSYRDFSHFLKP
ncbi:MAG: ribokinase [Propionibacteriaceae bacterium]|jgi:ribokinase|nr:ribokinase [Propionibacteriaceae bacterium]